MRTAPWRACARASSVVLLAGLCWGAGTRDPLETIIDERGPYLILATEAAAKSFAEAIRTARELHPDAAEAAFDPESGFAKAKEAIGRVRHRYALVFVLPEELDCRVAWEWLRVCTEVDRDPFVDVRSGFATGASPTACAAFLRRIATVAKREAKLPPIFGENLGPTMVGTKANLSRASGSFMLPVYERRFETFTISHPPGALVDPAKAGLAWTGIVHLGGHGFPDGIVDGLRANGLSRLALAPCVIFNGACYTGVTARWFDVTNADGLVHEQIIPPEKSFSLGILDTPVVGYLAALHPDHGLPVYQEMEFLATTGGSLGDAIKSTYDGIVLANGGRLPIFERLEDRKQAPRWTPSEMMLKGTASRILFGDPSLVPFAAFAKDPLETTCTDKDNALRITASVVHPELLNSLTDTYHSDLSTDRNLFNARVLLSVRLPEDWNSVAQVKTTSASVARSFLERIRRQEAQKIQHRVVGFAVEEEGAGRSLRVQVDLSSTGYRESPFLRAGSVLELEATR